jgi:hypothetical protein
MSEHSADRFLVNILFLTRKYVEEHLDGSFSRSDMMSFEFLCMYFFQASTMLHKIPGSERYGIRIAR